jgi:hypothetical protein
MSASSNTKTVTEAMGGAARIAAATGRASPPTPEIIVRILRQGLGEVFAGSRAISGRRRRSRSRR